MKSIKIKETYLLFLIVMGLISLATYSTYALFSASTEITDVVGFNTSLTTDNNILEYEMVTVPAGGTKIIELTVNNSYSGTLYYGAWYEVVSPYDTSNINVGLYTEKDDTPATGQIAAGASVTLLVGIQNYGETEAIVNVGTVGSLTISLGIRTPRILLASGWVGGTLVTDEVLEQNTVTGAAVNLSYNTAGRTAITLDPGVYTLQVWGAQGGNFNTTYGVGGLGGYSYGTLTLGSTTNAYVYVGGQGTHVTSSGTAYLIGGASNTSAGYNGGGQATYMGGGGGGASDIRLVEDSLYARVIVAGGGGGAQGRASASYKSNGGYGGGEESGDGGYLAASTSSYYGKKATLTAGGAGGTHATATYAGTAGTFGQGGNAGRYYSTTTRGAGAGGGGWYGGGGGAYGMVGGAGGSGWVYTSENAQYTDSSYTGGTWLLNPSYYLTDAATIGDGTTTITDFDGTTDKVGHSGVGAVKITGNKLSYNIPVVNGLTDLSISYGTSVDLNEGVTVTCETGKTGCSLTGISVADTSTLSVGRHTIYYTVKSSTGSIYKYRRSITVVNAHLAINNMPIPSGTYTVDTSACTSAIMTYDYAKRLFKVSNTSVAVNAVCTPIFTPTTRTTLASHIINLLGEGTSVDASSPTNPDGSTLELVNSTLTSGINGVDTTSTDYRYRGKNPNNYIMFNDELWRIIGVFDEHSHGQTGQQLVKIIRNDSIGAYVWDNSTSNGVNNYSVSSIHNLLNTTYYNHLDGTGESYCYSYSNTAAYSSKCDFTYGGIHENYQAMVKPVTWYLGGYTSSAATTANMYQYERSTVTSTTYYYSGNPQTVTNTNIGLMYLSDYGYASPSSCTSNLVDYNTDGCANNNWLKSNNLEWTLIHRPSYVYQLYYITETGSIVTASTNAALKAINGYAIRPTLYLDPSVYYLSGNGTKANPYKIGI